MQTVSIPDRVRSETEQVTFGFCIKEDDPNFDTLKNVGDMNEEELAIVAARFQISPEFLSEINSYFESLRDAAHQDLADIWARLEK